MIWAVDIGGTKPPGSGKNERHTSFSFTEARLVSRNVSVASFSLSIKFSCPERSSLANESSAPVPNSTEISALVPQASDNPGQAGGERASSARPNGVVSLAAYLHPTYEVNPVLLQILSARTYGARVGTLCCSC